MYTVAIKKRIQFSFYCSEVTYYYYHFFQDLNLKAKFFWTLFYKIMFINFAYWFVCNSKMTMIVEITVNWRHMRQIRYILIMDEYSSVCWFSPSWSFVSKTEYY